MADSELRKNDVVGNWRLEKTLGTGGQASVWRVRYVDDKHSPAGALKICSDRSQKARARFKREHQLLDAQTHPSIVRVRDGGEHQDQPYFVMELATTTLAHVAIAESAGTRLILESREILFRLLRQVCEGVAHLHRGGILHRDIKPNNVLLMLDPPEPMRAVLADLGLATNETDQGHITATHEMLGTPAFRAPESFSGKQTARSDVYSLGKTIEAVLNRCTPSQIGPGTCLRDERLTEDLWDDLDQLLARACAFDPALRYDDAGALVAALPHVVLGLATGDGRTEQARRPNPLWLTVAERVALSDVIAECPATGDRAHLHQLRQRTRLNEYHFAISIRRLEEIGFLETSVAQDQDGDRYTMLKPVAVGVKWAQEHHDDMVAAMAEVAPKASNDGDIPF